MCKKIIEFSLNCCYYHVLDKNDYIVLLGKMNYPLVSHWDDEVAK